MINKNNAYKTDLKYTQRNFINIKELINFYIRNRITFSIFTVLSIITSLLVPIKNIWEGKTTMSYYADQNFVLISGFASDYFIKGIKNPYENIFSALNILKDESFLKELYKFYKEKKLKSKDNSLISYNKWKENISFKLDRIYRTISITYKDPNKEIASSILNKIYLNYKQSSNSYKSKFISETLKEYLNLTKKYEKRSRESLKLLSNFKIKKSTRVEAVKELYSQIIEDVGNNKRTQKGVYKFIEEQNQISSKYNPNEFTSLLREATLNSSILNRLLKETELLKIELNIDKIPWNTRGDISFTLNKGTSRYSLISFGIISGILLGSVFSLIKESKNDILYSSYEINENYKYPFLGEINISNKSGLDNNSRFINKFFLEKINDKIIFISPSEISKENLLNLELQFNRKDIQLVYETGDLEYNDNNFILIKKGYAKRELTNTLINQLSIIKMPIKGIIIIS